MSDRYDRHDNKLNIGFETRACSTSIWVDKHNAECSSDRRTKKRVPHSQRDCIAPIGSDNFNSSQLVANFNKLSLINKEHNDIIVCNSRRSNFFSVN